MPTAGPEPHQIALVTITESLELQAEPAFAAATLARLGHRVFRIPTDFCTTEDDFRAAVTGCGAQTVVFVDGVEWREILAHQITLARQAGATKVLVVGDTLVRSPPEVGHFPAGIVTAAITPAALAPHVGGDGSINVAAIALDYAAFGDAALLRRGVGCSLFAEPGTVALVAERAGRATLSPVAALARLAAPVGNDAVALSATAATAPLAALRPVAKRIEWWDRDFPAAAEQLCGVVGDLPQTARVLPAHADEARLRRLKAAGITRVVLECDALDTGPRLVGAAGAADDVVRVATVARRLGLEVGVILVVGLPGETAALTRARCARLDSVRADAVRVVPFEPTGGHPAYAALVAAHLWPPLNDRWKREVHQPLLGMTDDTFAAIHEAALCWHALVATAPRGTA